MVFDSYFTTTNNFPLISITFENCFFLVLSMSRMRGIYSPDSSDHWVKKFNDFEVRDGRPLFHHSMTQISNCARQSQPGTQALLDELPDRFDCIQVRATRGPAARSDAAVFELLLRTPGQVQGSVVMDEA
jgi:hypothetical protein